MKGPQSKALLLNAIEHSLAGAKAAEAQTNKTEPLEESSWTEEQERLYQQLEAAYSEFSKCDVLVGVPASLRGVGIGSPLPIH